MPLTRATAGVVVIDDSDSTNVSYQGRWDIFNGVQEFHDTAHKTDTAGSTVTFYFTGMVRLMWQ